MSKCNLAVRPTHRMPVHVYLWFLCMSVPFVSSELQVFGAEHVSYALVFMCPHTQYSSIAATACECAQGYRLVENVCVHCRNHEYKNSVGNTSCLPCPEHSSGLSPMQSVEECLCEPGYHWNALTWQCEHCASGTYKAHHGNDVCLQCFEHASSAQGSTAQAQCQCVAGYTADASGTGCIECGYEAYKSESGMQACSACGSNSRTLSSTSEDASACLCIAGYYKDESSNCVPCEQGYYKDSVGNEACSECGNFMTTTDTANTDANACVCDIGATKISEACEQCAPGTFKAVVGDGLCSACGNSTWSPSGSQACSPCPVNSVVVVNSLEPDSIVPVQLKTAVLNGTQQDCKCLHGYQTVGGSCVACEPGKFKASVGDSGTTSDSCLPCPAGTFYEGTAATSCLECTDNSISALGSDDEFDCLCESGFYRNNAECVRCADGYIKSEPDASQCVACDTGTFSSNALQCADCPAHSDTRQPASTSISDCLCLQGYEKSANGEVCQLCAAGYYCPSLGSKQPCPYNSMSPAGSDAVVQCVCLDGFYRTDDGYCATCPVEHFCTANEMYHCPDFSDSATSSSLETQCTCNAGYEQVPA